MVSRWRTSLDPRMTVHLPVVRDVRKLVVLLFVFLVWITRSRCCEDGVRRLQTFERCRAVRRLVIELG